MITGLLEIALAVLILALIVGALKAMEWLLDRLW